MLGTPPKCGMCGGWVPHVLPVGHGDRDSSNYSLNVGPTGVFVANLVSCWQPRIQPACHEWDIAQVANNFLTLHC